MKNGDGAHMAENEVMPGKPSPSSGPALKTQTPWECSAQRERDTEAGERDGACWGVPEATERCLDLGPWHLPWDGELLREVKTDLGLKVSSERRRRAARGAAGAKGLEAAQREGRVPELKTSLRLGLQGGGAGAELQGTLGEQGR